jgi:hypothetical protein
MDVSKRYYEQLKWKTLDQKNDKKNIVGCESLVQYLKKELKADAENDWKDLLDWISDQT